MAVVELIPEVRRYGVNFFFSMAQNVTKMQVWERLLARLCWQSDIATFRWTCSLNGSRLEECILKLKCRQQSELNIMTLMAKRMHNCKICMTCDYNNGSCHRIKINKISTERNLSDTRQTSSVMSWTQPKNHVLGKLNNVKTMIVISRFSSTPRFYKNDYQKVIGHYADLFSGSW